LPMSVAVPQRKGSFGKNSTAVALDIVFSLVPDAF